MASPSGRRGPSRKRDRNSTGRTERKRWRRGRGGEGEGRGEEGGAGGGCVEQREQWVNPLASKPDRETELSQTNQATGGVWVGVVPCVLKALARPPRAPWETTLARSPNPGKCGNEESYGKIQGRAGERPITFVECLGVSQKDTMRDSLWRVTLGRSMGPHDAVELVGGMCHGNGRRQ